MSLSGLTIAVTGSRRASELAKIIHHFGGIPYLAPTIGIEAIETPSKEIESFLDTLLHSKINYAVFMTGPGVYSLMSAARKLGLNDKIVESINKMEVIARSSKPKSALRDHGIGTNMIPGENTAEGIIEIFKRINMKGKKVAILWHGSYSPIIKNEIESSGGQVSESSTYNYSIELKESGAKILQNMGFKYISPDEGKILKLIEDISEGLIDVVTFTSPPSVRNLVEIADNHKQRESLQYALNEKTIVVAVGPPTRMSLEENGINVDVMPEIYKMGPMIKALIEYVEKSRKQ